MVTYSYSHTVHDIWKCVVDDNRQSNALMSKTLGQSRQYELIIRILQRNLIFNLQDEHFVIIFHHEVIGHMQYT